MNRKLLPILLTMGLMAGCGSSSKYPSDGKAVTQPVQSTDPTGTSASSAVYQIIEPEIAHQRLQEEPGILLLDVRSQQEHDEKHIPGSIVIPLEDINSAPETLQQKDATIFVYCRSGRRSETASKALIQMGYTHVYNVEGGILNWSFETE